MGLANKKLGTVRNGICQAFLFNLQLINVRAMNPTLESTPLDQPLTPPPLHLFKSDGLLYGASELYCSQMGFIKYYLSYSPTRIFQDALREQVLARARSLGDINPDSTYNVGSLRRVHWHRRWESHEAHAQLISKPHLTAARARNEVVGKQKNRSDSKLDIRLQRYQDSHFLKTRTS